jgi:hypothetical protein
MPCCLQIQVMETLTHASSQMVRPYMHLVGWLNEQRYMTYVVVNLLDILNHHYQAGFIVNEHCEIIQTLIFRQSFEEITATPGKLNCGLTCALIQIHCINNSLLM